MIQTRYWWIMWLCGLAIFALLWFPHAPLAIAEVPRGIVDHQAAGSAAEVDRIHAAWSEAGVLRHAMWGMIGDFIFITVYGLGCILAGKRFRLLSPIIGQIIIIAGFLFLVTDYAETLSQFIQLYREKGFNSLAGFAALMQPIKIVAFIIATAGIVLMLLVRLFSRRAT